MKPTIGRIVHYRQTETVTVAALITFVYDHGIVNLATWTPHGTPGAAQVGVTEGPDLYQWHWPPRQPAPDPVIPPPPTKQRRLSRAIAWWDND